LRTDTLHPRQRGNGRWSLLIETSKHRQLRLRQISGRRLLAQPSLQFAAQRMQLCREGRGFVSFGFRPPLLMPKT
jgi:hypothetical protein